MAEKMTAFLKVTEYLTENDNEQTSINDLTNKMQEFLDGTGYQAYTGKYMKQKMQDHFGDKIIVAEVNGKANIVTFRSTASSILSEFYHQPKKDDCEKEKLRLVTTAALLIKNDIKAVTTGRDNYPSSQDMAFTEKALDFIPHSLQVLLKNLLAGKESDVKLASLGQAVMQAIRSRVLIAPLQLYKCTITLLPGT